MKLNSTKLILTIVSFFFILSCGNDDNDTTTDESPTALSSENELFALFINKGAYNKSFLPENNIITGTVDSSIDLMDITLVATISENASISPDPSTITTIDDDFTFTVTAENGDNKSYEVSIERELATENFLLSFQLETSSNPIDLTIDQENNTIIKRIPEGVDLSNLQVSYTISERATIDPDPSAISDYSSPIDFNVTSESGDTVFYTISLTSMTNSFTQSCDDSNFWKWFGGDDRDEPQNDIFPFNRNVGTGQAIALASDFTLETFSIALREGFRYSSTDELYNEVVTLILNIINSDASLITSVMTEVPASFNGGLIDFDLKSMNLFFKADETYIFQWYLKDGTQLGVVASSPGTNDDGKGFCFGGGFTGESKINTNTSSLDDQETWGEHGANFNIAIEGKQ